MLFNFPDRVLGQVLVYLSDDACFDIGMECVSQVRKRSRRSYHDKGLRLAGADHLLHRSSDPSRKSMLFDLLPIGGLDCASPACCRGLGNAPRPVGALLVAGRIFILKDFLGPEIGKCLVALISQEQSPTNTRALCRIFGLLCFSRKLGSRAPALMVCVKHRTDKYLEAP